MLLHSMWPTQDVNQEHKVVELRDGETYLTVVHPDAQKLIEFARDLVGPENVYLLTLGMRHYALKLNEVFEWNFDPKNIRAREDWAVPLRVGYGYQDPLHERWNKDNVLIDNLRYEHNEGKCNYLGIKAEENYLKVRDFYGITKPGDTFYKDVVDFLEERHSMAS